MLSETNINRMPLIFKSDEGRNYFQFHINGQMASLEYQMIGDHWIDLKRLEISKYLDKEEVGNALLDRVFEYAHRAEYKIVANCNEVQVFLLKNSRYQKIVVTNAQPTWSRIATNTIDS